MLNFLHLQNVGPSSEMRLDFAPRLNILTGDNGLGKSFLLDVAWWALTRNWPQYPALPNQPGPAHITYEVAGKTKPYTVTSAYTKAQWPLKQSRPPKAGVVIYVRVDGGFSVWDPVRNYYADREGRTLPAYHFSSQQVWDGLEIGGRRVGEGLERDWLYWQEARRPQFEILEKILQQLSAPGEYIAPGTPCRVFPGEGRDRPTLQMNGQTIPLVLASAGVKRILSLAYFLVWAWFEHRAEAELRAEAPEQRCVILFDEAETHLHPRWQRSLLPSLLSAFETLHHARQVETQMLLATHSPLILASLDDDFDQNRDQLFHLHLEDGQIKASGDMWEKQGEISNWLISDVFGLGAARSLAAEKVINAALSLMRGESDLPSGLQNRAQIHRRLQELLPADDSFWPHWLLSNQQP